MYPQGIHHNLLIVHIFLDDIHYTQFYLYRERGEGEKEGGGGREGEGRGGRGGGVYE